MNFVAKSETPKLTAIVAGFILVLSFFAFTYTAQAGFETDNGAGIPLGEQQVSPPETKSETTAQGGLVKCGLEGGEPCTFCDFFGLFNTILNWVIFVVVPAIAVLFIVFGGFMLATSRGNPSQLQKGKDMLIWTFAGIVVIFVGWMILNSLLAGIGVQKWTGLRGETGSFETHFSDGRLWDADRSGDKAWEDGDWNGFTIELNHPSFSKPKIRTITKTTSNTVFVDSPLFPYTQENIGLEYKIGGWWQFSCGL